MVKEVASVIYGLECMVKEMDESLIIGDNGVKVGRRLCF